MMSPWTKCTVHCMLNHYRTLVSSKESNVGGVAQWLASLTRNQWTPVRCAIELHQRLLLFPWPRNFSHCFSTGCHGSVHGSKLITFYYLLTGLVHLEICKPWSNFTNPGYDCLFWQYHTIEHNNWFVYKFITAFSQYNTVRCFGSHVMQRASCTLLTRTTIDWNR